MLRYQLYGEGIRLAAIQQPLGHRWLSNTVRYMRDPVEDFLWNADHGLDSPIFQSFLAGYLTRGQLDHGAPERFAFYQLEHCLGILGWAHQRYPEYFAQAQWLIEQALDGARLDLA